VTNLLDFLTCAERSSARFSRLSALTLQVSFHARREPPRQLWNAWYARCEKILAAADGTLLAFISRWGVPAVHIKSYIHSRVDGALTETDAQEMVVRMFRQLHTKKRLQFTRAPPQKWMTL
jgi:hypothetical protein